MIREPNHNHELGKQDLPYGRATYPEAPPQARTSRRLWVRVNATDWHGVDSRFGDRPLDIAEAHAFAIRNLEEWNIETLEIATRPTDECVFYTDNIPAIKGQPLRKVIMVPQYAQGSAGKPTAALFRSLRRAAFAWGRLGQEPCDIFEIGPGGAPGKAIWRAPRALRIDLPSELENAAPDRLAAWERIADRLADEALKATPIDKVDGAALARAAFDEYRRSFREADLPADTVKRWSPEAQDIYRQFLEAAVCIGLDRYSTAQTNAIEAIAAKVASEICDGTRTI